MKHPRAPAGQKLAPFLDAVHRPGGRGRGGGDAAGPQRQGLGHGRHAALFSGAAPCRNRLSGLYLLRLALLLVNGLTNLTTAGLLLRKKPAGVILGGIFGITLMLWICIQFYMFPLNFMSTAYFLFGAVQAATGYAAWVFAKQEAFRVDPKDYKNVGTDPRRLVVYFSRMGYVRKMAYEAADRTRGGDLRNYVNRAHSRYPGLLVVRPLWDAPVAHAHCPDGLPTKEKSHRQQ